MKTTNRLSLYIFVVLLTAIAVVSCNSKKKYVIAVVQCSDVEVRVSNAKDDVELQKQQLLQFVEEGVDLIIVSPITSDDITLAVEQAMDKGVPVITFDRKIQSDKYTAHIGCDNYQMGYTIGNYVAREMNWSGKVVEITGLQGSSPMIERHSGFVDAISQYPEISIIATVPGDWIEQSGFKARESLLRSGG